MRDRENQLRTQKPTKTHDIQAAQRKRPDARSLPTYNDIRAQTAKPVTFAKPQDTPMRPRHIVHDGKAKTHAAAPVLIARRVQP